MNTKTALPAAFAVACAVLVFTPAGLRAQGVGQQSAAADVADEITVVGQRSSSTAPGAAVARDILERVPGGIGFVEADRFLEDFAQSIGDTLIFTPGVFADTAAQRETRISIRGSGLNSSFERRGISVRRDGVPISRASGSTEFQEIDPLTIDYIEVFKGANGLRYGAASLGGAVNIMTPTGRGRGNSATLRAEGGSFDTARASGSVAFAGDRWDFYTGVTGLRADGYRDHSDVRSVYAHANLGRRFDGGAETRLYLTAISDNFELAGSLALDDALANPTAAGRPVTVGPFFPGGPVTVLDPGPAADDWDRNLDLFRIANKTVVPLGGVTLEAGAWYAFRELDHAITRFAGVIAHEEHDAGGFLRLTGDAALWGLSSEWVLGAEVVASDNDARRFENVSGERGALRSQSDQDARNVLVYGQLDIALSETLTAVLGVQSLATFRDSDNLLNSVDGDVSESQLNPRFGLLWDIDDRAQLFFNVNRGFEPAGIADLTAGGILDFTPLEAQQAWTVELGTRGQRERIAWDLAVYRSWIEHEFIDLAQPGFAGVVSATFNADETVHQGLELGFDLFLTPASLAELGGELRWRNAYTYNDFYFASNPEDLDGQVFAFDGNRLAGVPEHVYVSELRLDRHRWYAAVNFRWVPDGPFVDFANTVQVPGYELWGVTAGVDVTDKLRVFVSAENLSDEVYISNVSTVANQSVENARVFTPGQGRAVFGGLSLAF